MPLLRLLDSARIITDRHRYEYPLSYVMNEGLAPLAHFRCLLCLTLTDSAVNRSKVGKWTMLVDQLFGIRDFAPVECQTAFLITEVLFLTMLQVIIPYFLGSIAALRLVAYIQSQTFSVVRVA